jgi:hypothetical protein
MELCEMNGFVLDARQDFRAFLEEHDGYIHSIKNLIKEQLAKCGSVFEEQTLTENLKEEFNLYLDTL